MTMKDFADLDHRLVAIGKQLEKILNDWEVWAAKADILCSLGMHEVAIRCCDRSLELNPKNVLTWVTKGEASRNSERTKMQMRHSPRQGR